MNLELQAVVLKVLLHLGSIHAVDILVRDCKHSAPLLVAIGQLSVCQIKDAINESEVVGDLLVTLDMEALGSLRDGGLEIRHDCV